MDVVYLARHGETAWNAMGKLQGHTDVALNDVGRAQAQALGEAMAGAGIASIVTSDLSRARETGELVAAHLGLVAPEVDPELRERRFGILEGLTREECAAQHPEVWSAWVSRTAAPPGGEPIDDAVVRMDRALARITAARSGRGPTLVISHGGLMRLWLNSLLGADVPLIRNGTVYRVERDTSGVRARLWTAPLPS